MKAILSHKKMFYDGREKLFKIALMGLVEEFCYKNEVEGLLENEFDNFLSFAL